MRAVCLASAMTSAGAITTTARCAYWCRVSSTAVATAPCTPHKSRCPIQLGMSDAEKKSGGLRQPCTLGLTRGRQQRHHQR